MKLASYNVENLFMRARALNGSGFSAEGSKILKAQADINSILGKDSYTATDKKKIIELLDTLGLKKSDESKFAILRQNRGHLVKRPQSGPIQVVANGRDDWIGWVDLTLEQVNEAATRNTARVIKTIDADVLGVVEAESRPALVRFCKDVMPAVDGTAYDHIMLIDGNDERGIDVGLMTKKKFNIVSIASHVDDEDDDGVIYSRDCAQFEIETADGNTLIVLANHFKSKGFGSQATSDAKRERQPARTATIYRQLRQTQKFIAIVGDFNDTPDSGPLAPLFSAHQAASPAALVRGILKICPSSFPAMMVAKITDCFAERARRNGFVSALCQKPGNSNGVDPASPKARQSETALLRCSTKRQPLPVRRGSQLRYPSDLQSIARKYGQIIG